LHQPQAFNIKDDKGKTTQWTDHGGMRTVANEVSPMKNVLPPAERTFPANDKELRKQVMK
jgi:hypothetical protein